MSDSPTPEHVWEISTNLDDLTGELIAAAVAALLAEGALDAWTQPLTMKKGRPGVMLSLLCRADDRDRLARRVLELTGSFGVRYRKWDRLVLHRSPTTLDTAYGPVRAKVGELGGRVLSLRPEYEDARRAAREAGVDGRRVYEAAQTAAETALHQANLDAEARGDARGDVGGETSGETRGEEGAAP